MNKNIIIVYADNSGGVKAVSKSLFYSFSSILMKADSINLNDFGDGFLSRTYKGIRHLSNFKKDSTLILQHFHPIFLGLLLRPLGFNKIINVIHTDLVEYYNSISILKKLVIKTIFLLLRNSNIVFVSKEAEEKAIKKFKLKNTYTIYNFYNSSDINTVNTLNTKKNTILGSISRLNESKNIDLLICVAKKASLIKDFKILIYGEGNQKDKIEEYIRNQNCNDFIKLVGASNDKESMYSSIDAIVSFSSIEGFGMTILESISYGKPVFYTDCSSGPREIMSPMSNPLIKTSSYEKTNVGYLVKPTQRISNYKIKLSEYECEYVDFLTSFIEDIEHSRFNMEFDSARFEEETIVKQWLSLVNSL